ncbi:MAG: UDP-glucose dehydrogenase [Parcubacteria bacterium C7867-001]|nr:MAG: UDP-glucose dehydrogenase [Parcubacteria bacterium C7867-001]
MHTTTLPQSNNRTETGSDRLTVAVIGLGYVGLPIALLARDKGYIVSGIDTDPAKRKAIKARVVADLDPRFERLLANESLTVSNDYALVHDADIIMICVPTPVREDHTPDLEPLKNACRNVGRQLLPGHMLIIESTIHPGTCEEILLPILEEESGLIAGEDFGLAHCPERVNPGDDVWTIDKIARVIGGSTPSARRQAANFYRSILDAPVHEMETIREAEAVKMVENSFRDINIAFVNELAMSFTKLNIDVVNVLRGASTKPFGFMLHLPGCGVGGHCIPVDPYYLIDYARINGFAHRFLSLAREINNSMPEFTVGLLEEELTRRGTSLRGAHIALLGLSYKPNVSDMRESPALEIKEILEKRGATMAIFDPYIPEHSNVHGLREALHGADAVVLATSHDAFVELTPDLLQAEDVSIIIDGRNFLAKDSFAEAGITYRGIGRS